MSIYIYLRKAPGTSTKRVLAMITTVLHEYNRKIGVSQAQQALQANVL